MNRFSLGTAQFGMAYGIANKHGKVGLSDAGEILAQAKIKGINSLDTAIAYGDSESVLGQIGIKDWRIISKLPPLPESAEDIQAWVVSSVGESLQRLQISALDGLLLHRPADLLGRHGKALYASLVQLQNTGKIGSIGVSIYDPVELEPLLNNFELQIVQAPFNVLDRRLVKTGWLEKLKKSGIEVQTRSAFLQGLLLLTAGERPAQFSRWSKLWTSWDNWLLENKISALDACLSFVLQHQSIDKIVIGVDSVTQLNEILTAVNHTTVKIPEHLFSDDLDLLNPGRWSKP